MNKSERLFELDLLRGVAVLLMVVFHIGYDLALFGYASYQTTIDTEWILFRGLILSMFLLAVGMSAYLAYIDGIRYDKLIKTVVRLLFVSVMISVGSYFVFPQQWIYFGVIHFIAFALVCVLPFIRVPRIALVVGIAIGASYIMGFYPLDPLFDYSVRYWGIPAYTVDVVSFTPWFSVVLIGVFVMDKKLFGLKVRQNQFTRRVALMGQHSLLIYLIHQPLLFGLFYLTKLVR